MRPRTKVDDGGEPIGVQFLLGRIPPIQCSDRGLQSLLECRERAADIVRRDAFVCTDADAIGFEAGFASKTSDV